MAARRLESSIALFLAVGCSSDPSRSTDAEVIPDVQTVDAGVRDSSLSDADLTQNTDSGVPDAALGARSYCEATVDAFCGFYVRCGRVVAADEAACRDYFLAACNSRYELRYAALEDRGLLELNPSGLSACAQHLATVACERQVKDLDGPCASLWFGKSPEGAPCGLDVESFVCGPGTTCILGLDFCGECKRSAGEGQGCGDGVYCATDAECVAGVCVQRPLPGDACGAEPRCALGSACVNGVCVAPEYVTVGSSCDQARRCPYGASCVGGTCHAGSDLGGACGAQNPCAIGRCVGGTCAPLLSVGGACGTSLDCESGPCVSGLCTSLPSQCFD